MSMIEIPAEFKAIARNISADVFDFVKSLDDLVACGLVGVDDQKAAAIRPFLRTLLGESLSSEELSEFWSSLPSGIHISNGEAVRTILSALLARLEREPYLTGRGGEP